ncbi:hypothetical protein KC345_g279 [Hortaea werneckii]|nr:hypothetical protein KC345_g279 [Hortaea werneckii]
MKAETNTHHDEKAIMKVRPKHPLTPHASAWKQHGFGLLQTSTAACCEGTWQGPEVECGGGRGGGGGVGDAD